MQQPLQVTMIQVRHDLKDAIQQLRQQAGLPHYIFDMILTEIQAELRQEEIEAVTALLLKAQQEQNEVDK